MRGFVLMLVCCGILSGGCASMEDAFKPRDRDYRDDVNDGEEYHDEWDSVRKEGRGSDPSEKEWDPWTKHLMSPKAMAIERNLGYGY